jgi:hypothetical protein
MVSAGHSAGARAARDLRHELIIRLYREGLPVAEIAQRAGVCVKTVRNVARRAGLPPRNPPQPKRDGEILARYAAGHPVGAIAADNGVGHAFYEYVGCPDRPLTMLNLSASARQRQLPRRPAAEARIFSRRIVEALRSHGVVARKSATLTLGAEAAQKPAVWLGLLDGDGSVGIYRDGALPRVRFSGTHRLMQQCERFWRHALPYTDPRPAATPHRKSLWQFSLQGRKARGAAILLLAASPTSLLRKRAILAEIAAWEPAGAL